MPGRVTVKFFLTLVYLPILDLDPRKCIQKSPRGFYTDNTDAFKANTSGCTEICAFLYAQICPFLYV